MCGSSGEAWDGFGQGMWNHRSENKSVENRKRQVCGDMCRDFSELTFHQRGRDLLGE